MSATVHVLRWGMHGAFDALKRDEDGSWTCTRHTVINHPSGRIEVSPGTRFRCGSVFMGVDVAAWLDAQAAQSYRRTA